MWGSAAPLSGNTNSTYVVYKDGKKEVKTELDLKFGDENYLKVYNIKMLAGRPLQAGDSTKAFVINNNYAKVLGFNNPADALNKMIAYNGKQMEIVGVTADFHQSSLRKPITPIGIFIAMKSYQSGVFHIALKPQTPGGNEWKTATASMGKAWKEIYPDDEFSFKFLMKLSQSFTRTSSISQRC